MYTSRVTDGHRLLYETHYALSKRISRPNIVYTELVIVYIGWYSAMRTIIDDGMDAVEPFTRSQFNIFSRRIDMECLLVARNGYRQDKEYSLGFSHSTKVEVLRCLVLI